MSEVVEKLNEMITVVAKSEGLPIELPSALNGNSSRVEDFNLKCVLHEFITDLIDAELKNLVSEAIDESKTETEKNSKYITIPLTEQEDEDNNHMEKNFATVDDTNVANFNENLHSDAYHKLWNERKVALEKEAERRARVTAKQWQRDKIPLRKIIDDSLKEYIDLYEKAHSLYLQFEHEKSEWINRIRNLTFPEENELVFQYEIPDSDEPNNHVREDQGMSDERAPLLRHRKRKFTIPRKEN